MNENLTKDVPPDGVKLILAQLSSMDSRLTAMDTCLAAVETHLTALEARFIQVETRLTNLEERVDRRLSETRPIWEQVLVRLDKIESRRDDFDQKLIAFGKALDNLSLDMRTGFKRLERQMGLLAKDLSMCGPIKAIWSGAWTGWKTSSMHNPNPGKHLTRAGVGSVDQATFKPSTRIPLR
jgi:hypothetical protein